MTAFIHDCLDQIFEKTLKKQPAITKCLRLTGNPLDVSEKNDPFKLYQGYLDIVKPMDYDTEVDEYKYRIAELEQQLNDSDAKCDAI